MTKDEIEKALECCTDLSISHCKDCPYNNKGYFNCVSGKMCKDALALITEQEKEIEKQNSRVKVLKERLNRKYAHISNAETEYEKAFGLLKSQRKEIDILKENLKNLKDDFDSLQKDYEFVRDCDAEHCIEIEETVKQAKIDVLNELKKRIYDISPYNPLVTKDDVKRFIEKLSEEVENGKDIS